VFRTEEPLGQSAVTTVTTSDERAILFLSVMAKYSFTGTVATTARVGTGVEEIGAFVDGRRVGVRVGVFVGTTAPGGLVGFLDGRRVGVLVGVPVGVFVGTTAPGGLVGFLVGVLVGFLDGRRVGVLVGVRVGVFVGTLAEHTRESLKLVICSRVS